MDLSKFFDRVQHDVLMARAARKVRDRRVLRLIGRFLRAGVLADGLIQATEEGTPQGGPLSPPAGAGYAARSCGGNRVEPQGLLASLQDVGDPHGHGQQVVLEPGLGESQVRVEQACPTSANRLVRTRMLGGVGGGVSNDPAYPIGLLSHFLS